MKHQRTTVRRLKFISIALVWFQSRGIIWLSMDVEPEIQHNKTWTLNWKSPIVWNPPWVWNPKVCMIPWILNLKSLQSVWNLMSGRVFKYFLNQSPKEECKAYGKDIKSYVRVFLYAIFLSPVTWPCGIWFFNQMVSIWWSNCALNLKFVFLELLHTNTELCEAEECSGFWKWENRHPVWAYGSRSIERLTVELPSLLCKEVVECFVDSF